MVTEVHEEPEAGQAEVSKGKMFYRRYRWIGMRVLVGIATLVAVSFLIYLSTMALPGNAAVAILGKNATPEKVAALSAELGLDRPFFVQYFDWLWGMMRGDFGTSLITKMPVDQMLASRLVNSATLIFLTVIIGFPIAILLGIRAAYKPGKAIDSAVNSTSIVVSALPEFVVALLLVYLLATGVFRIFPAVSLVSGQALVLSNPIVLVLPVLSLVIMTLPYLTRQIRGALQDALGSEYVVMAELKGLDRAPVLRRHALPNSLASTIQSGALTLAYLIGGTVVIEFIFQFPGIGAALQSAVLSRDLPVVQFIVLVFAAAYVVFNLIADILTVFVTPKLRTA